MTAPPDQTEFRADLDAVARIGSVPTILEMVCRTTGLRFAAVARVTDERWIACAVRDEIAFGLTTGGELAIETTLCNEVRGNRQAIVIDHAAEDETYCGHPTPRQYGFQSYISVPIFRTSGEFFGTLCAIDPAPANLKKTTAPTTLALFAQLIAQCLESQERELLGTAALMDERGVGLSRERFIGVLGHDLRNPLGAIVSANAVLNQHASGDVVPKMTGVIQRSAARIQELVTHMLDLARGRLSSGMKATKLESTDLEARLLQVVQELRSAATGHEFITDVSLQSPVLCDAERIEQMLSNLVSNAVKHGDKNGTVWIVLKSDAAEFELSVANVGTPIEPAKLKSIFRPFEGTSDGVDGSLGLGLFICSEIAQAHGGAISVTSNSARTTFTFRMPSQAAN